MEILVIILNLVIILIIKSYNSQNSTLDKEISLLSDRFNKILKNINKDK